MDSASGKICDNLLLVLDRVKCATGELAEEQGLTRVQMIVLYYLDRHEDLAMGQVADALHCDASNITGVVDRLLSQNLITRQESTRDRRTKTLRLTDQGREVVEVVKAALPAKLGCDKLGDREIAALHLIAQKLSD